VKRGHWLIVGAANSPISQEQSVPTKTSPRTLHGMIKDNNALLQNKHYHKCSQCCELIIYDREAIDRQGSLIPLE
jgi:hypothetical protein